jgi:benzoyl-CoA reductase subunit A
LKDTDLSIEDMEYIVSTGYGRVVVPFAHKNITEISCHARGANWFFPSARTILDMGGQDCKAIRCDERGRVENFAMNDKCAAGTGRYMEMVAEELDLDLDDLGGMSLEIVEKQSTISSMCAVFARMEIASLLSEGKHKNDILGGACAAISERVCSLMARVGIENDLVISGGIAKNVGVVQRVEEILQAKAQIAFEPQLVGAVGASLFARDILAKQTAQSPTAS